MKKKIKDLTLEEYQKICSKYSICLCCPYRNCDFGIWICELRSKTSETEVEVDE